MKREETKKAPRGAFSESHAENAPPGRFWGGGGPFFRKTREFATVGFNTRKSIFPSPYLTNGHCSVLAFPYNKHFTEKCTMKAKESLTVKFVHGQNVAITQIIPLSHPFAFLSRSGFNTRSCAIGKDLEASHIVRSLWWSSSLRRTSSSVLPPGYQGFEPCSSPNSKVTGSAKKGFSFQGSSRCK